MKTQIILNFMTVFQIHVYGSDLTEMHKHVPTYLLPKEYGGDAGTIAENNGKKSIILE